MSNDTKLCDEAIPDTQTPPFEPTWEKFRASLKDQTGRVMPVESDLRWQRYYTLWAIGYLAALRDVLNYQSKPNETKLTPTRT